MNEFVRQNRIPLLLLLVCALVLLCYGQTANHSFFWDTQHIFAAEAVRTLSLESLYWLLTNAVIANWHPLTLTTHAVDFALFGWEPAGHHLVNVVIHCAVSIVAFACVYRLAGLRVDRDTAFAIAAITTILFSLHPLRVESVAWVAARKDLLYSLFYLLAIISYTRYCTIQSGKRAAYALSVMFFALSLMSKSMAVTLPAILILLDLYPLRRLDIHQPLAYVKTALLDKLPFALLSLLVIGVTLVTQTDAMTGQMGVLDQVRNACHNIVFYLERLFVPVDLAPFYGFPGQAVFYSPGYWLPQALFILLATGFGLVQAWRGQPLFLVCWIAYIAMLSPASGVIQVGSAVAADRYTYLSQLPVLVLLSLGPVWFWQQFEKLRRVMVFTGVLATLTLVSMTAMQVGHWKNPITLWAHVLRVNPDAALAHRNISTAYFQIGDYDNAIAHLQHLAAQGWPVASLLAESIAAADRVPDALVTYRSLLASPALGDPQRRVYEELVALLEAAE